MWRQDFNYRQSHSSSRLYRGSTPTTLTAIGPGATEQTRAQKQAEPPTSVIAQEINDIITPGVLRSEGVASGRYGPPRSRDGYVGKLGPRIRKSSLDRN